VTAVAATSAATRGNGVTPDACVDWGVSRHSHNLEVRRFGGALGEGPELAVRLPIKRPSHRNHRAVTGDRVRAGCRASCGMLRLPVADSRGHPRSANVERRGARLKDVEGKKRKGEQGGERKQLGTRRKAREWKEISVR
jgi:hypothetical protein